LDIRNLHNIYFLGIGGIGMSALARYFNRKGVEVSGYDKTPTSLTQELINEGMQIHFEENISMIPDNVELVVYTPAIPSENKELIYCKEKGIEILKRSEVLGSLTQNMFLVAVAGTHGKTTITSLIAHILKYNNKEITAFIGGISKNYNTNFITSEKSEIAVVEADEYDKSFLALNPDLAVISSMDADHLDIYGSKDSLTESFFLFSKQIKKNGKLIIKKNLPFTKELKEKIITYAVDESADVYALNIRINNYKYIFDLNVRGEKIKDIKLETPGLHNIENAVAASAVVFMMGLETKEIKNSLETYSGVKRRFEYIINTPNLVFIDDYAHHPEELKASILTAKNLYADKKITGIFQPHLFSRTRDFADEFVKMLELLDEIILLDIYPAREKPINGVDSKMLLDKIKVVNKNLYSKNQLIEELKKRKIEVLLTLGAGDIETLVQPIKNALNR